MARYSLPPAFAVPLIQEKNYFGSNCASRCRSLIHWRSLLRSHEALITEEAYLPTCLAQYLPRYRAIYNRYKDFTFPQFKIVTLVLQLCLERVMHVLMKSLQTEQKLITLKESEGVG